MVNKFERIRRNRPLAPQEVAHDADSRRKIEAEYPPKQTATSGAPAALSETLKRLIRDSSKSIEEIAMEAKLSPVLLSRFLAGERDIHVSAVNKLAEVLELKIAAG